MRSRSRRVELNAASTSTRGQRWRRRYGLAALGAAIIVAWILVALLAPWLAPYRPDLVDVTQRLLPPSSAHWLGTDTLGRDVLSRLLYGARVSLFVSILVVLLGAVFGTLVGGIAAYAGGWVEHALMRFTDLVLCFPPIILAMAIAAALGIGTVNTMIAMLVVWWPKFARLARGLVLVQRHQEYVEAAHVIGYGPGRVLLKHIMPNAIGPLIVLVHARRRPRDHRVRGAVVPRAGRRAADGGVGRDGGGGPRAGRAMVGRDVPRPGDLHRGDGLQLSWRRHT